MSACKAQPSRPRSGLCTSFNAVFSYAFPTSEVVYENYMRARAAGRSKTWLDTRVQAIVDGTSRCRSDVRLLLAEEWRAGRGTSRRKDIVFECFHNLLAFSQWGKMTYEVMGRLEPDPRRPGDQGMVRADDDEGPDDADGALSRRSIGS